MSIYKPCYIFCVLFLLVVSTRADALNSGNITGIITAAETGIPLAGVTIVSRHTDEGTSTDGSGEFSLTLEEPSTLILTYIGYQEKQVEAEPGDHLELTLQETPEQLQELVIRERKSDAASFDHVSKLDVPLAEIPQSISTVSADLIDQRGVDDITEALRSVSGIRPIERYGGFQTYTMRGFNDFVLLTDNVRDERHNIASSAPSTNLASVDRIEVLKGPASVMHGHSALGGVINVVRNQPTEQLNAGFSAYLGSYNSSRIKAGVGGPVRDDLRYRFDFSNSEREGWREYGQRRNSIYTALEFDPWDDTQVHLRFSYNNDQYDTDAGIPLVNGNEVPAELDYASRFNHPDSYLNHRRYDFQARVEHKFSDAFTLSNRLSYSDDDIDYSATEGLAYNESLTQIQRTFHLYFNHETKPLQNHLEAQYDAQWSGVDHRILGGYTLGVLDRKTFRGDVSYHGGYLELMPVSNPTPSQGYVEIDETGYGATQETNHSFYVQNWINPRNALNLLVSLRYDYFDGSYYTDLIDEERNVIEEGERDHRTSHALTYRLGALYNPMDWLNVYSSFSTYFKPSRTFTFDDRVFDPEGGYQGEVGTRFSTSHHTSLTLTGYYIQKRDMVIRTGETPEGQPIQEQVGMADSRGAEAELVTYLTPGWSLQGGYNYTVAKYREYDTADPADNIEGHELSFVPHHQFNIWTSYSVDNGSFEGLRINLGGYYMGENYTHNNNEVQLPEYFSLEGGLSYRISQLELSFNARNILDETYYTDSILTNQVYPAAPRNFEVGVSLDL